MINKSSSGCRNCMVLLRKIVLMSMTLNVRVFALHVKTADNYLADALSRGQMNRFWRDLGKIDKEIDSEPTGIPEDLWPMNKLWMK